MLNLLSGTILVAVVVGLIGTFLSASAGAYEKRLLDEYKEIEVILIVQIYGIVLLSPLALWQFSRISFTAETAHWAALFGSGILLALWGYTNLRALKEIDLSTFAPIVEMVPIVVVFLEPLLLGTSFNAYYLIAALIAVTGSSLVLTTDTLLPRLSDFKQRGVLFAMASPFLGGLASILTRFGTQQIPTFIYTTLWYAVSTLVIAALVYKATSFRPSRELLSPTVIKMGLSNVVSSYLRIFMLSIVAASFVTIYWQLTVLFSLIIGHQIFEEENIGRKLAGAALICIGVAITTLV